MATLVSPIRRSRVALRSDQNARWATRVTTVAAAALDAWVPGSPSQMTVGFVPFGPWRAGWSGDQAGASGSWTVSKT
ncbi:hypothetical protein C5746_42505 [Streptomyces atratus]|uniref:Uncharacterized protein n=1 Tax=Streptomyces atratus TaxID=1893 RepID=A0A2Z5JPN1_STRAR|nr:hypothetical protein C5746_00735 [Streptomyces atratus]AXE82411.1 hypothetical protein C5746_42505 [Streptomyces atratus]